MFNFFSNRNENQASTQNTNTENQSFSNQNSNQQIDTADVDYPTVTSQNTNQNKVYLKVKINGEEWNGIVQYGGSQYYPNANKILGVDSPYLQLAFAEASGLG